MLSNAYFELLFSCKIAFCYSRERARQKIAKFNLQEMLPNLGRQQRRGALRGAAERPRLDRRAGLRRPRGPRVAPPEEPRLRLARGRAGDDPRARRHGHSLCLF